MRSFLLFSLLLVLTQCKSDQSESLNPVDPIVELPIINHVNVQGAKQMIATNKDLIIIDARTSEEYADGTLPGAINVDVRSDDFAVRIDSLDKSAVYLMHCRSGSRSKKASEIMVERGFTNVTNMDGGYLAWLEEEK